MSARFGRWGTGFRIFGEAAGYVDNVDLENLGLALGKAALNNELEDAADSDAGFMTDGNYDVFNGDQVATLTAGLAQNR